ncbi:MAG: hypothetical protein PHP08_02980 [Candidatus Dojkabacteria bacterium]|nr:hypothetical protein [Candidatus Dojkabacteria bacterium]
MSFTALQFVQNSKKPNTFVGVFRYVKTSGVKSIKNGELYGFIEISSEGEFPAERVAHMAWDGVVEGYMYSQSKSISDSLKSGVQEFTRRLKDLMRNSKNLEEAGIDVSLVIVSATKDGVYVANLGENEIFAYRGQKIVDVVDILEKNNAQTAGFMISNDDLLVISTNSLLSENMHTLIGKNSREEILKSLSLLGKTLLPDQGIFCIFFEKETKEKPQIFHKNKKEVVQTEDKQIKEEILPVVENSAEIDERSVLEEQGPKKKILENIKGLNVKKYIAPVLGFFTVVWKFLSKIFSKVGNFLKRIFSKIKLFLTEKLGSKRWFKKYSARVSQSRLGKKKPEIKIDGYKTKDLRSKRIRIIILATLGIVLLVGGYQYARKQKVVRELHSEADDIFQSVSAKIESAKSNLSTDTEEAETDIFAANNLLEELPEGLNDEYLEKKNELEEAILSVEDSLYKRVVVSPESFVGFFDEGTELTDIEYVVDDSGNEILIIADKGTGSVWEVSIYDRSKSRMADNNGIVKYPEYVDIGNEGDIFVYDSGVGVIKAPESSSGWGAFETLTGVGLKNIGIDNVGEFAVLTSSDNLYYLDTVNARIVKSVNYGTGYSSTVVSVINDENFVNAHDFFADFSIYVLTSGNDGVLRYSAGTYVPITITGVNGTLGELTCGDTSGSMDYGFYMFDQTNNRILKFEKPMDSYNDKLHPNELVLLNQYVYRGDNGEMWNNIKDIAIDQAEKYIYILDGNNVWRIGL